MGIRTGFGVNSNLFSISYKTALTQSYGEEEYVKSTWFKPITEGTSGQIVPPEGGTILLDQWDAGVDAIASTLVNGYPNYQSPKTAQNEIITASMDGDGNYTLSGVPSVYPICIIYQYRVRSKQFNPARALIWYKTVCTANTGGTSSGQGLPSGGAAGAILRKKSAIDFDTEWVFPTYLKYDGSQQLTADWNAGANRKISVGKIEAKSIQTTASGTITRTNGLITSVSKNDGTTITINRTSGKISSIVNGSKTITLSRDGSNNITGWTVS